MNIESNSTDGLSSSAEQVSHLHETSLKEIGVNSLPNNVAAALPSQPTGIDDAILKLLQDMAVYAPPEGTVVSPTAEMGFGWRAKSILERLGVEPPKSVGAPAAIPTADVSPLMLALAQEEIARLNAIINEPHNDDFIKGMSIEAEHQSQRWGTSHDIGKEPTDWCFLIGALCTKAVMAQRYGDMPKALHHLITSAAATLNMWRSWNGQTKMRPGIGPHPLTDDAPQPESAQ